MGKRWIVAAAAAAGLAAVALSGVGGQTRQPSSAAGGACGANAKPANLNFTLKDVNGKDVKLASFKGKVVLLNFWATWCGPCRAEIPAFVEFRAKHHAKGFEILGISVDDPPEALRPFADQFKVNYPLLVGSDRDDVQEAYGPIFGVPQSVLISRDGRICRKFVGEVRTSSLERAVAPLL